MDCPACQGEGEILPYGDPMAYETRCPECNGEGKLNAAYAQVLLDGEKHYEPVERNAFLEWIDAL